MTLQDWGGILKVYTVFLLISYKTIFYVVKGQVKMEVTYIGHSGFLLDTGSAYFLFDYYTGIIPEMDKHKPLVVFVSHKHKDHFNPVIFGLADKYPDVLFVLAKGVPYKKLAVEFSTNMAAQDKLCPGVFKNILLMKKDVSETVKLPSGKEFTIRTLRSTDEGVAFLLGYNDRNYYHAGDLNIWVWEEETPEYNRNMVQKYIKEIEKLKGIKIDIAFVPLDPRLGSNSFMGLETFLAYTESSYIFPMHCWGNYSIIDNFTEKHPEYKDIIAKITHENMVFQLAVPEIQ